MFRLILEESTQVTKSSILLRHNQHTPSKNVNKAPILPCDEECRVRDYFGPDSYVALLNEAVGCAHGLRHAQTCHDDTKASATECGDGNLPFHIGELSLAASTHSKQAHIVQLLK